MSKFKCKYRVDDGFVGSREKVFYIQSSEIEDDMDEADIENLFSERMQEHFEQNVFPGERNRFDFVEWAESIKKEVEDV